MKQLLYLLPAALAACGAGSRGAPVGSGPVAAPVPAPVPAPTSRATSRIETGVPEQTL